MMTTGLRLRRLADASRALAETSQDPDTSAALIDIAARYDNEADGHQRLCGAVIDGGAIDANPDRL